MARSIDAIQRDIERTRNNLANTLDELAQRAQPKNLVNEAKQEATVKLQDPMVQKILIGAAVVFGAAITIATVRSRKRSRDLKELRNLLASR